MKRREFIALIGGAAAAWPVAAQAQQRAMPVIGFLSSVSPDPAAPLVAAFRRGLKETGYVEGQNVAIEYRWAENQYSRLPEMAADLVRKAVQGIATTGGATSALAAKSATVSIPIVFQLGGDPVELGLVASLSRPGGNLTGVTNLGVELGQKQLELLHEIMPAQTVIGVLVNPTAPYAGTVSRIVEVAARALGRQIRVLNASNDRELEEVFASVLQIGVGAVVIGTDAFFNNRNRELADLTLRYAVPAVFQFREFTAAGGLMAYGGSREDAYHLVGVYTGRILKGERPADLPVQQTSKAELILNLRAAKALGLTLPTALLVRANEVIE